MRTRVDEVDGSLSIRYVPDQQYQALSGLQNSHSLFMEDTYSKAMQPGICLKLA